jgi:hypothetical protein
MTDGVASPPGDPDFAAMAQDELARALTLGWRELAGVIPWGDSYDGISPAGRDVVIDRNYIWQAEVGGDILVEVAVYGGPSRYDTCERASAVIARGGQDR